MRLKGKLGIDLFGQIHYNIIEYFSNYQEVTYAKNGSRIICGRRWI